MNPNNPASPMHPTNPVSPLWDENAGKTEQLTTESSGQVQVSESDLPGIAGGCFLVMFAIFFYLRGNPKHLASVEKLLVYYGRPAAFRGVFY